MMHNFSPYGFDTATIAATTVSARVALSLPAAPVNADVRVYNAGGVDVFIAFGDSTVAATTARMPVAAGTVEVFAVPPSATHAAAITSSGAANIYFTTGAGS